MEKFIDAMLESIFGSFYLQLNVIVGVLFIALGAIMLLLSKKRPSMGKKAGGFICLAIGCLGVFSGVIQMLYR